MEKLYTVSKNKTRSCGSGHELLIAKFRLKLKKVGKITRPSSYKRVKSKPTSVTHRQGALRGIQDGKIKG